MSGSVGLSLNTNISSSRAQRRLGQAVSSVNQSFARLSSGLRITKGSDDAAGLAVATALNVDSRVYTQGLRNLNDGASYLSIAEGAAEEMKGILFRLRELSTQASNGVLGNQQRGNLDAEAQALSKEFNRILESTEFNGVKLFDRDQILSLQAGYGTAETLTQEIGTRDVNAQAVGEETVRVSVSSSGVQGNNHSFTSSLNADGRFVAFQSDASNLVAGDTNGQDDIFVYDRSSGTVERVSVSTSGTEGNNASVAPRISADGRFITFTSSATNLVAGDANATSDIFVHDRITKTTELVSLSSSGTQGTAYSVDPRISADGRFITFTSGATNLVAGDTNSQQDVFVRDLLTRTTERVSVSSSGAQSVSFGNISSSISADGRYVSFTTFANNLVSGDTNGDADILVHDRLTRITERVSLSSTGTESDGVSDLSSISADGRYVIFQSLATNLVAGDSNGVYDVFVHDRLSRTTERVSVSSTGAEGNALSGAASISADARYVAFSSSASNLVAGDTNSAREVFVRDRLTNRTERIALSTQGAEGSAESNSSSLSADGRYVSFRTLTTNLVAGDTNGFDDILIAQNRTIRNSVGFNSSITPLVGIGLSTQAQARFTQDVIDDYFDEINVAVGTIGAFQSRIQTAAAILSVRSTNTQAAASQILDADVAEEAASMSRGQVIQNAAQSVLAQANIQPRVALSLLTDL